MPQADGENLIGPDRTVAAPVTSDGVVQAAGLLIPELAFEAAFGARGHLAEVFPVRAITKLTGKFLKRTKRVVPQRLDLDRLTVARRNNTVSHLRVHPG